MVNLILTPLLCFVGRVPLCDDHMKHFAVSADMVKFLTINQGVHSRKSGQKLNALPPGHLLIIIRMIYFNNAPLPHK